MESEEEKISITINKGPTIGIRHVQLILMFLMTAVAYGTRVCLSIAIVAMTDEKTSSNPNIPTFKWENKSVILSSFYWGYLVLQIPAAELCKKFGTKWFLIGAMFINSSACVLTPIVAQNVGSNGVMACRVLQGLSQGFFYPAIYDLLGQWAPVSERSLLATIATTGSVFGTIVTLPLTGLISSTSLGWPAIFYMYGSTGFTWIVLWYLLGASSPVEHKTITTDELNYIQVSLGVTSKNARTPWKAILTSAPIWAITICHIGQEWGYTTLLTEMPNYMSRVMKYDIKSNGVLSAMPFLAAFLLSFPMSHLSDFLMNRHYMNRGNTRRLFTTLASVPPAAALITIGFLPNDASAITVVMLIFTVGINAAAYGGYQVSHPDLSPRFAGIIIGIGNATGNISSILAPLFVNQVVKHDSVKMEWRIIFISSASMYLISNFFYLVFASGEVQPWNYYGVESEVTTVTRENEKIDDCSLK